MSAKWIIAVASAIFAISCARADWISSWGDGDPNAVSRDFAINQDAGTITILHGDGLNYKFYSETALNSGLQGVINNITVSPTATGDFTLLIQFQDGSPGALHWRAGNLTYPGGTSTLLGINIADRLCSDAFGTSDILVENIVGDIRCVSLAARVGGARSPHFTACVDPHELVEV